MRCGDCIHWHSDQRLNVEDWGICTFINQAFDGGMLWHDLEFHPDEAWYQEQKAKQEEFRRDLKAMPYDGSGYLAGLQTRVDFGCVLFELKEGIMPGPKH